MPEDRATHITVVLDRSGSMSSVAGDAIGGFNTFLAQQQRLPGAATLTLVQFDHEYQVALRAVPVGDVKPLTIETFVPRGQTALYDAVGHAVADTTELVNAMPPEKRPAVVVAILTDGEENASREIDHPTVQKLIKEKTAAGWEFVFLGANMDVKKAAARMGIGPASAIAFQATGQGTREAFGRMSEIVSASRRSGGPESSGPKKIH
jgi:hypothetical protein